MNRNNDVYVYVDLGENRRLVFHGWHRNGAYVLGVRHERVEKHEDYVSYLWEPFADGNFSADVKLGRKSEKQMNRLKINLDLNKDDYLKMWHEGRYKEIILDVRAKMAD